MLLVHRRHVVEPVEIRQVLQVGAALHQLLGAAVQQADVRVAALDDLAVELEHQPQNAMRRRVLRPEVDVEVPDPLLAGQNVLPFPSISPLASADARPHRLRAAGPPRPHHDAPFFSSPGRMYSAPSQGLMKSNSRYSWVSFTGS